MKIYKYTPALTDPKMLDATLVGRDAEFKRINKILKNSAAGNSFSHVLFVGPKGIGKSHVLRLIYNAVKGEIKTGGLNRYKKEYIPVIFSEEEYITNLTKFILLIIDNLVVNGFCSPADIPRRLQRPSVIGAEEKEAAVAFLKNFSANTGKLLLLLVDNLNEIVKNFTEEDQGRLRSILMTANSLILIGAAPTLFEAVIDHGKPLYNFFEIIWLRDLTFAETVTLMKRYAKIDENQELISQLAASEAKLRALYELAGGNPRLVLSLFHIMADGDISSTETTLLTLLDELSPYFRARMKDLSAQQQEIIDAMAKSERLLTPTEIAAAAQLEVNKVNAQIRRLEKSGYVKKAPQVKGKRVIYDLSEKLFSLWRQMRVEAGRKRLGFIIKFLTIWFTKTELIEQINMIFKQIGRGQIEEGQALRPYLDKLWYLKEAVPEYQNLGEDYLAYSGGNLDAAAAIIAEKLKIQSSDSELLIKAGVVESAKGNFQAAESAFKKALKIEPKSNAAWFNLGNNYINLELFDKAVKPYENAIKSKPKDYQSLCNLGNIYIELGKYDKAINYLKKSLEVNNNYKAWIGIGEIYFHQNNFVESYNSYLKAAGLKPDVYFVWHRLGEAQFNLKKYNEAVRLFKMALKFNPKSFNSWVLIAQSYNKLNKHSQEADALENAIKNLQDKKNIDAVIPELSNLYLLYFISLFKNQEFNKVVSALEESFNLLSKMSNTSDLFQVYVFVFKEILKSKKISLLKKSLQEITNTNNQNLVEFISPFFKLVAYLNTNDTEILDRLKPEERFVVEEMIKFVKPKKKKGSKKSHK